MNAVPSIVPLLIAILFVPYARGQEQATSGGEDGGPRRRMGHVENILTDAVPSAPADRGFGGSEEIFQINSGKQEKRAILQLGLVAKEGLFGIALSTPWEEDDSPTTNDLDLDANATKAEFSYSRVMFEPPENFDVGALERVCERARNSVGDPSAECDSDLYDRVTDRALKTEITEAYFGSGRQSIWVWNVSASLGNSDFDYFDDTLTEQSQSKTPASIGGSFGRAAVGSRSTFVIFEYKRERAFSYAKDSKGFICEPSVATSLTCKEGFLTAPTRKDRNVYSFEYRRALRRSFAIAPSLTVETEKHTVGIDVPFYLFRNSSGAFAGGIRLEWDDGENEGGVSGSVFVSTGLELF